MIVLVLAILLIPQWAMAVPSISGTSGALTHRGSVTISGSSFGAKGGTNANKPLIWADFEGESINPTSLGHITAWDNNYGPQVLTSGGVQYGLSSANAVGTWPGADGSITVKLNRGAFASNASAYLYVIDSTNAASSGFAITFGAGAAGGSGGMDVKLPVKNPRAHLVKE